MRKSTATRLASKMEAMGRVRSTWLACGSYEIAYSPQALRAERDDLLKASVELRRLAAKKGKRKQSKVGA